MSTKRKDFMSDEHRVFLEIIGILKEKGKEYKKRVGYWYCYDFNGGFTLVYDSYMHYMSLESGHTKRFTEDGYFGPTVKVELFLGEPEEIVVGLKYLEKIKIKLNE
jgi:hypothetical protein